MKPYIMAFLIWILASCSPTAIVATPKILYFGQQKSARVLEVYEKEMLMVAQCYELVASSAIRACVWRQNRSFRHFIHKDPELREI